MDFAQVSRIWRILQKHHIPAKPLTLLQIRRLLPIPALDQADLERQPQPVHPWQVRRVVRDAVAPLVGLHHHFIHYAVELGDGGRVGVAAPVHQAGDAQAQIPWQALAQVLEEVGVFVQVLGAGIEVDLDAHHRVTRCTPTLHLPEQFRVDRLWPTCLEVRYIQGGVRDKHGTLGDNRGQAARTIAKRLQPMQRAPGSPRQTESTSTNFQPGSKARPGHSLCNVEPQAPSSEAELLLCTVWSSPGQPSQPPSLPYARLDIAAMTIWIQHSLAQRSSVGGR